MDPEASPNSPKPDSLDDLIADEMEPAPLPPYRYPHRQGPIVVVTLLKTVGVTSGLLALLIGIAIIVLAILRPEDWQVMVGILVGVLVLFLGLNVAVGQVALAHLVEASQQAAGGAGGVMPVVRAPIPEGAAHDSERAGLLREILAAVQMTDDEKRARAEQRRTERAANLAGAVHSAVAVKDFAAARQAMADLAAIEPSAAALPDLARQIDEAEAAARHSVVAERDALYERITALARNQQWRETLDATNELVERYPDSDEARNLRPRIAVLHEKIAAIDRRRLLAQARLHIRDQRWPEAYAAASDLVKAYPDSPEAADVFSDLPRLRRLAKAR